MDARWSLQGKRALITGGSRGIGAAVADGLLAFGAEVVVVARDATELEAMVQPRRAAGMAVSGLCADLSLPEGRAAAVEEVRREGGRLDILVNNVGTNIRKKTVEYEDGEYDRIMDTNLRPAFELSRRLHPLLKQAAGCIVNIASVAGLTHVRTGSVYGMSKAALVQLTRNLACEWAVDGVRVNAVAPWYIRTPLANQVLNDPLFFRAVIERTPLRRVGDPADVAAAVTFLCLPAAGFITGQCLGVDGGFSAFGF